MNSGIILDSYIDVFENLSANSSTIDVIIDDTDSDREENENTDHDSGTESEDININKADR